MHLAAESHVDRSIDGPSDFISTNIHGTYTLLEAVRRYWNTLSAPAQDAFRFHHVSTDEVFGSLGPTGAFSETTPYAPNSPYSASKASSDHLARAWHHTYGLPVVTSNCSNNYGPYQFPEKLIPLMILNILQDKALPVYGTGMNVRDWLYVDDHAKGLLCVATQGTPGECYNIGGSEEHTNIDIVRRLCTLMDELAPSQHGSHERLITYVEDRPGHDARYAVDSSKIQNELGWRPDESFESGLRKSAWAGRDHMTSSQKPKVLVVGCNGQVGRELLDRAAAHSLRASGLDLPEIDITDETSVRSALAADAPDLIVNAAAYTAVDKAESESTVARAVNETGPKVLAEAAGRIGVPLFHISTDYVFDGQKHGPYEETDPVAPLGVYGVTKAAGDEAVRASLDTHIILRTAWVYSPHGGNFVKTMLRLAGERDELSVVGDQHGCPTAAGDVADALLTIASRFFADPESMHGRWGTYHFCSGPATTWHGFAEAIMQGAASRGSPSIPVRKIPTTDYPTPAKRPANSVLDCAKIERSFDITPRPWPDALDETLQLLLVTRNREDAKT
eukprot:s1_g1509.t1